jgi:hypothetical protein
VQGWAHGACPWSRYDPFSSRRGTL